MLYSIFQIGLSFIQCLYMWIDQIKYLQKAGLTRETLIIPIYTAKVVHTLSYLPLHYPDT